MIDTCQFSTHNVFHGNLQNRYTCFGFQHGHICHHVNIPCRRMFQLLLFCCMYFRWNLVDRCSRIFLGCQDKFHHFGMETRYKCFPSLRNSDLNHQVKKNNDISALFYFTTYIINDVNLHYRIGKNFLHTSFPFHCGIFLDRFGRFVTWFILRITWQNVSIDSGELVTGPICFWTTALYFLQVFW